MIVSVLGVHADQIIHSDGFLSSRLSSLYNLWGLSGRSISPRASCNGIHILQEERKHSHKIYLKQLYNQNSHVCIALVNEWANYQRMWLYGPGGNSSISHLSCSLSLWVLLNAVIYHRRRLSHSLRFFLLLRRLFQLLPAFSKLDNHRFL